MSATNMQLGFDRLQGTILSGIFKLRSIDKRERKLSYQTQVSVRLLVGDNVHKLGCWRGTDSGPDEILKNGRMGSDSRVSCCLHLFTEGLKLLLLQLCHHLV